MPTFEDIQNRVNSDYLNRTDLTAETKRAIQAAIRHYERQRFWWNENTTTLTASVGQTFLTVPTDFLVLDLLQITRSSADYALNRRDFGSIRDFNITRTRGYPTDFAIYQNRFELAPIPDSAYTFPCYYIRSLTALSASSDTNDWLSAAENLIVYHATKVMWANVLRNTDMASVFQSQEREALTEIKAANEQKIYRAIRATRF